MGGRGTAATRNSFNFQPYGNEDYITPFPRATSANLEAANEIARFNWRLGDYADIPALDMSEVPEVRVSMDKLFQSQDNVGRAKIESLMKLTSAQLDAIRDEAGNAPFVIKYGDTYVIQDGHHRLSAMKAKGAKTATVKLFELKKRKNK